MKYLIIKLVRFYQKYIAKLTGANCPFTPSCSQYMIIAVYEHGVVKGIFLGLKRILRCNPFNKGNKYDPVPLNMRKIKWVL